MSEGSRRQTSSYRSESKGICPPLTLTFLFCLAPQWIAWCPATFVRVDCFTDSNINLIHKYPHKNTQKQGFTSFLGNPQPIELIHKLTITFPNHHFEITWILQASPPLNLVSPKPLTTSLLSNHLHAWKDLIRLDHSAIFDFAEHLSGNSPYFSLPSSITLTPLSNSIL